MYIAALHARKRRSVLGRGLILANEPARSVKRVPVVKPEDRKFACLDDSNSRWKWNEKGGVNGTVPQNSAKRAVIFATDTVFC